MKTVLSLMLLSFLLIGCNVNPNKEARIQKLEAEIQVATKSISELENKLNTLESENSSLLLRVKELEAL